MSPQEALVTVFVQLAQDNGGEAWLKISAVELVGETSIVPLVGGNRELAAADIGGGQRFLARGSVLAADYRFLRLSLENAALLRGGEKFLLALDKPVVDLPLPGNFQLQAGESRVLIISWDDKASVGQASHFTAKMAVLSPHQPLLADLAYVSCPDIDTLYLLSTDRNRVSGSLAIKGRPSHMVYSAARKRLYVLSEKQSTITVVETATNRIVDQFKIPMIVSPSYFMSPQGNWGYILDEGGNYLIRMDLVRGSMDKKVRLGYQPRHLVWYEASQQLILSSALDQKIYFVDPETLETRDIVPAGSSPDGLLVDGDYLYVAEQGANNIGIFDLDSRQVVKRLAVGFTPRRLLKKDNTLYVSNSRSNSVSLVLVRQQRVVRSIAVGSTPLEMAAADRSKWLYVAAQDGGVISVIDQTSNKVATTIELGSRPADVVVVD
ncbi:MAG: beta-propeller fold lactonase family protein [Proteobacteria bacterium]|nr:beta-propeller fold lactonase family protein [Pseudomonadota bacterium]MBU1640433.1 beta-propeller fold lactonase family protein [Pseudomonadota bacterium]